MGYELPTSIKVQMIRDALMSRHKQMDYLRNGGKAKNIILPICQIYPLFNISVQLLCAKLLSQKSFSSAAVVSQIEPGRVKCLGHQR